MRQHIFLFAAVAMLATTATTTTIRAQDDEHHQVTQADNPLTAPASFVLNAPAELVLNTPPAELHAFQVSPPAELSQPMSYEASAGPCYGCLQENFVSTVTTALHAVATSKLFYLLGFIGLLYALSVKYLPKQQHFQLR